MYVPPFIERANNGSGRVKKKLWKYRYLGSFSKAKTEDCDQNVWNVYDQFGITIPCSATYFMEVGSYVSLKMAIKVFLRAKKNSKNLDF